MLFCAGMTMTAQKIDFDFPNRNTSEVTEPGYIPWPVNRCERESKTFDNGMTIHKRLRGCLNLILSVLFLAVFLELLRLFPVEGGAFLVAGLVVAVGKGAMDVGDGVVALQGM